jgi:amino acid adenylation domain-containing protein
VAEVEESIGARRVCELMHRALETLTEALEKEPGRLLAHLDVLPEAERRQVLDEWNETAAESRSGRCLAELFEAQVTKAPDAVAVVWGETVLSYGALNRRANRLAHYLRRQGVGADARVGVLLERGVDLIVTLVAIVKAGGAYVPLDPGYPAERLRYMLADADARVLVSRNGVAEVVTGAAGVTTIRLDEIGHALDEESEEGPASGVHAENLAYVVYTSGSTGTPKGVMISHAGVVQLVVETNYVHLAPGDRVAQASNASFDAVTFEAWGALLNGAVLVGIDKDVVLSPTGLGRVLRQQRITTLYQTTALFNELTRQEPDLLGSVREVLFGGEAADAESVRRVLRRGKPGRLLHMYGPTETTAWCSYERVEAVAEEARTVPVGRPTRTQQLYVLDRHLEPAPVDVAGEAYAGGGGLARGYLGRPGLTAERFVPNPYSREYGGRMYQTGDRMRWRADGRLEFQQRLDFQVKIRGFRIELGEIEAALRAQAGVREAVVVAREDTPGQKRLVAYYTGSEPETGAEPLRAGLSRTLPEYMVPVAFVKLERVPLTPNGKLDRQALPAPEAEAFAMRGYEAPQTDTEQVLATIFAELLKLERVGRHDSFFELGGHSLLVMSLVAEIRRRFGCDIRLFTVFTAPTVCQIAARIHGRGDSSPEDGAHIVPLQQHGTLPPVFCVHPGGGEVHAYARLAYYLGSDQPLFGVRDIGEDLGRPIAQIAREHVEAILAVQPEGPYYLLGWSFGGLLVWEMAALLERRNKRVAFVGVIDQFEPRVWRDMPELDSATAIVGFALELTDQARRPFSFTSTQIQGLEIDDQIRSTAEAMVAQGAVPNGSNPVAMLRHACDVFSARTRNRKEYAPASFSGTVTLFKAEQVQPVDWTDSWTEEERRTRGWCRRASGRIEVHEVPGTHGTVCLEPNVGVLAERLQESLAAARMRDALESQLVSS